MNIWSTPSQENAFLCAVWSQFSENTRCSNNIACTPYLTQLTRLLPVLDKYAIVSVSSFVLCEVLATQCIQSSQNRTQKFNFNKKNRQIVDWLKKNWGNFANTSMIMEIPIWKNCLLVDWHTYTKLCGNEGLLTFPRNSVYPIAAAYSLGLHLATTTICGDAHACLLWHSRSTPKLKLFECLLIFSTPLMPCCICLDDKQRQVLRLEEASSAKTIKHLSQTASFQKSCMTHDMFTNRLSDAYMLCKRSKS